MDEMRIIVGTREAAHRAAMAGYAHAQALMANGAGRVVVMVAPAMEPIGVQQRRFFHGPVLGQISEHVYVGGIRYTTDVWKEHFRKMYLPDTFRMLRLPGQKRATPQRVRHSTEDLGPRLYSEHIEQVIAYAVTEFGVEFRFDADERQGAQYVAPARKKPATA